MTTNSKKWQDVATEIVSKHTDWNSGQIFRELQNRGLSETPTHINTVQKWRAKIDPNVIAFQARGLTAPWHSGTLKDNPLPPESVTKIYAFKQRYDFPLTIIQAQWFARLSHLNLPLAVIYNFAVEIALAEEIATISGVDIDTSTIDNDIINALNKVPPEGFNEDEKLTDEQIKDGLATFDKELEKSQIEFREWKKAGNLQKYIEGGRLEKYLETNGITTEEEISKELFRIFLTEKMSSNLEKKNVFKKAGE